MSQGLCDFTAVYRVHAGEVMRDRGELGEERRNESRVFRLTVASNDNDWRRRSALFENVPSPVCLPSMMVPCMYLTVSQESRSVTTHTNKRSVEAPIPQTVPMFQ